MAAAAEGVGGLGGEEWDEGGMKEINERRLIYSVEGKHSEGGRKDGMGKEVEA